MGLEICNMEAHDLPLVLELENICFKDPWNIDALKHELEDNPYSYQIVLKMSNEESEIIVGFCVYWITFDSSTICQIAVHPSYRRKHLGTLLMNELLEECFAKRVQSITLEVRKSNETAIKFYEKCGFQIVTTKPHYYNDGEDAYYMVRKVDIKF